MSYDKITFETRGRVALITLNRPEKLNAWSEGMMAEMRDAMNSVRDDASIGALVVTGAGRAFCAGKDVSDFQSEAATQDAGVQAPRSNAATGDENWVSFVQNYPKPTIAAINGVAVGIGITQILPFDFRIASEHARVGFFFIKMALVPELASSHILPQMVGTARAIDWCLTGRLVPAGECREAGLVSEVVAHDKLNDRALELGEQLSGNAPGAMSVIRNLILTNNHETDVRAVMRSEGLALADALKTWEHREAITAFMEKRPADFAKPH
jgi:2-(1,2-epoxy-1,2-dihydrophenyl)acetyl-CoA isomerase